VHEVSRRARDHRLRQTEARLALSSLFKSPLQSETNTCLQSCRKTGGEEW
jgi:hypothetical protein